MSWRGLISRKMLELRFNMCGSSAGSAGARAFVQKNYEELKLLNPNFPFLIRPAEGIKARVTATYDWGAERTASLEGLDEDGVARELKRLVAAGDLMPRSNQSDPEPREWVERGAQ